MFVLYETPAGYAIFKVSATFRLGLLTRVHISRSKIFISSLLNSIGFQKYYFIPLFEQILDEKKISQVDNLYLEFETPDKASKM